MGTANVSEPLLDTGRNATLDYLRACGAVDCEVRAQAIDNPSVTRLVAECSAVRLGGGVAGRFIVKCFSDDSGEQTFSVMRGVEEAILARPDAVLRVPRALWYDPLRRCLIQERVEATPVAAAGANHLPRAMRAVGEALAELHALPVQFGASRTFDDHLHDLFDPHPDVLCVRLPGCADRVGSILAECRRQAEWGEAGALLHRDFHLRQLFRDPAHVWVIDWDLCACGDPALDVGNFVMTLGLGRYTGDGAAATRAFLAGYALKGDLDVFRRVPAYVALSYLRRACKSIRLGGAEEEAVAFLVRAEDTLEFGIQGRVLQ